MFEKIKLSPKFKVVIKLLQIAKVAEQLVAEGKAPWGRGLRLSCRDGKEIMF